MYDILMGGPFTGSVAHMMPWMPLGAAAFGIMLLIASVWSLAWKGVALWYAARSGEKIWFVVLLIVNTLGILEILYIFFFRKEKRNKKQPDVVPKESALPVAKSSPS